MISSEKNLKFGEKVILVLLEKGLLKYFQFVFGSGISGNYLQTTVTFGKLQHKFSRGIVMPYLNKAFLN